MMVHVLTGILFSYKKNESMQFAATQLQFAYNIYIAYIKFAAISGGYSDD